MIRFLISLAFGALVLLAAGSLFTVFVLTRIDGPLKTDKLVYIAPGTGVAAMGQQLSHEGAVDAAWVFRAAAIIGRRDGPLMAGEYMIEDGMSAAEIVDLLQSGKTFARSLTVPEGLMAVEIVALVSAADGLEGEITEIPPEGSLLPETYHYRRGDQRQAVIARMQRAMTQTLDTLWETRTAETPVSTREELVTLASIVEKETGVAAERAKVAGVFANRLRIGMPLQSDPTTIYALTEGKARLDRALLRKDLTIASPYNTYSVKGLPPGPIANPGRLSLQAVIAPAAHSYLYFVADGTGGHAFATTLAEHNANVAKWRQVQRRQQTAPASAP